MSVYDESPVPVSKTLPPDSLSPAHPLSWEDVTQFCMRLLFSAMSEKYVFTYYTDNPYKMRPVIKSLCNPAGGSTHVCTLNGETFICTPISLTSDTNQTQLLYRMESGRWVNGKLICQATLITPDRLMTRQMSDGPLFSDEVVRLEFTTLPNNLCPKGASEQHPSIIHSLLTHTSSLASALGVSLLMSYWYALFAENRVPNRQVACWSLGQLIQLQDLFQNRSLERYPEVKLLLQNNLLEFANIIMSSKENISNMNFIAYSYLKMLVNGDKVHIDHFTTNMPDELRGNFFRSFRMLT